MTTTGTFLHLPSGSRTPTSTNPSSPPDEASSGPGTPASGISSLSTTAIKDGHEGHHPITNFDVAADRVARLGGLGPPNASSSYFERPVNTPVAPLTPSASSAFSDGRTTPEGDTYGANSTQAKRETMAAVIARRQLAGQVSVPGQQQLQPPGGQIQGGQDEYGNSPAPSTATTQTTSSVSEARNAAKMIDGMTYDDNVVDTTSEGVSRRVTAALDDVEMKDD